MFMKTFIKQANKLSTTGIEWTPEDGARQVSKFYPTCCVADARARAGILNMTLYNGHYSCPFCEHVGVQLEGSMMFPIPGTVVNRFRRVAGEDMEEEVLIPPADLRTDISVRNAMQQAHANDRVRGFIGPAEVAAMSHFDLGIGCSTDDLHPIYEGVAQFHTDLLLEGVENVYPQLSKAQINLINRRIQLIKTPTHITRKPRPLKTRKYWKASEWRNWLLYYAIPCLRGIVPDNYLRHFGLLSEAAFLLSRDIIREEDLVEAEHCLDQYVTQFQEFYGPQKMRFNVHILTHLVQCVRNWGPLWAHSTFPFESWNHTLKKTIKSAKGAIDQIAMRYLMSFLVRNIPTNQNISQEVKDHVEANILGNKMPNAAVVDRAYFIGELRQRDVREEETVILAEEGYNPVHLTEYARVKVHGLECRTVNYREDIQSLNSIVYTTDDVFCKCVAIVVFEHDGAQVGGMFATSYEVGDALLGVSHIVHALGEGERFFYPVQSIRNLGIKIVVREETFVMPVANQSEID